ncbi:uncharacterized protein [Arachis hypogaea]|uniref:uncharacterized protein isoform X4 n=1 Tax=Arachis hypogaea TaxID=3818 RepID=UPI003B21AE60
MLVSNTHMKNYFTAHQLTDMFTWTFYLTAVYSQEMEVDLGKLQKMSSEYAVAKNVAIAEASNILDVTNIKHLSEDKESIGDVVKKIADDWNDQKETFYKQTGCGEDEMYEQELLQQLLKDNDDDEDNEKRG